MPFNLILNSSNVVSGTNNSKYRFSFPSTKQFRNSQMAVAFVSMYYSNYNVISSLYNNNSFTYTWSDNTVVTVTLPDGNYSVSQLNQYLQYVMIQNGHYLVDSLANNVYYLELLVNATGYNVEIISFAVPTSLPSGYTKPAAATWSYPVTPKTPYITIGSNNFGLLIGYTAGNYPSSVQTTTQTLYSSITPQIAPVQMYLMSSNMCYNPYSNSANVIYALTAGTASFGNLITSSATQFIFSDIADGSYSYLEITFYDQNMRSIQFQDSDVLIMVLIKEKGE